VTVSRAYLGSLVRYSLAILPLYSASGLNRLMVLLLDIYICMCGTNVCVGIIFTTTSGLNLSEIYQSPLDFLYATPDRRI